MFISFDIPLSFLLWGICFLSKMEEKNEGEKHKKHEEEKLSVCRSHFAE